MKPLHRKNKPLPQPQAQALTGPCVCGHARGWLACCGPSLDHPAAVRDAEALMRSRYSAFVLERVDHLLATWHPSTRPAELALEPGVRWLGLEVRAHRVLGPDAAEVEFVARSRVAGRGQRLHEISRFVREAGLWYYVDGQLFP